MASCFLQDGAGKRQTGCFPVFVRGKAGFYHRGWRRGKAVASLFSAAAKGLFSLWRFCKRYHVFACPVSGFRYFPRSTNGWAAGFWKSVSPVSAKTVNRVIFYGENTGRKCRVSLGGKNGSLCMPDSVGFWQEPFRQPADNRKPPGFTTVSAMKGNEMLFFQTGSWLVLY